MGGDLPLDQAIRAGASLRSTLKRGGHGTFVPTDRDPVAILEAQSASRLPELTAVRFGRMLQSPFAYYRGTAAVMATDLATDRVTGPLLMSCGDAHISNFGLYASPERRLLFDLNDFDESAQAPWEWDVKRLAGSVVVGARDAGFSTEQASAAAEFSVRRYRETLAELHQLSAVERYFYQVETDWLEQTLDPHSTELLKKTAKKARGRTSDQVMSKIVVRSQEGRSRMVDQPPIAQHVEHGDLDRLNGLFEQYRSTLRSDVAVLLSQFTLVDYILRVVGVGSVGTRCYVLLFEGPSGEAVFLQAKEAPQSVLETHGGITPALPATVPPADRGREGHRVVSAQRILQAQSDPFLGWVEGYAGERDEHHRVDYYWRQFRDMKGSVELGALSPAAYETYVGLCGQLLARAHSQSPAGAVVTGYLGRSEAFDRAIARWSHAYADQAEKDYEALAAAARSGRVPAEFGV